MRGDVKQRNFPTTQWTLVQVLQQGTPDDARQAQERLAALYWMPVYAFARRNGLTHEDASDLTQSFFSDVVYGRELFVRASPDGGRMRHWVLAALRRFLTDEFRRRGTVKHQQPRPLPDGEHEILQQLEQDSPQNAFDRRWALSIFHEALKRCEEWYVSAGRSAHWAAFDGWVLRPAAGHIGGQASAAFAASLGFDSPTEMHAAIQTVKRRLQPLLREVVIEQCAHQEHVEAEFQDVLRLLR